MNKQKRKMAEMAEQRREAARAFKALVNANVRLAIARKRLSNSAYLDDRIKKRRAGVQSSARTEGGAPE